MPTIANVFLYDVPKINLIDGTPCSLIPCPFCRGLHRLPSDTPRIIASPCRPHSPSFEERPRPDFLALLSGGPAWRELLLLFETGGSMYDNVLLLDHLQPKTLWGEIQTVPFDPLTVPDPFAGDPHARREIAEAIEEPIKRKRKTP
jgi:hypothetical protein